MPTHLDMLIIGLVQGLTEFLPVSSSGHLVIFGQLLDLKSDGVALEVFVHFGTLVAICCTFHKDILGMLKNLTKVPAHLKAGLPNDSDEEQSRSMAFYILISMVPAGLVGVFLKKYIESIYDNLYVVFGCLIFTGTVLLSLKWAKNCQKKDFMNGKNAIIIGLAQALAILPGISRSGTTITCAEWLGIKSELAAKFSFLMSIPVIAGATILEMRHLSEEGVSSEQALLYTTAMLSAAISGYFAIRFLMALIRKQKMEYFAYYCYAVAIIGLILHS